jgi:hypothetical protein
MPQTKQQKRISSLNRLRLSMDTHSRKAQQPSHNMIARRSRERSLEKASNIAQVIEQTTAALRRG